MSYLILKGHLSHYNYNSKSNMLIIVFAANFWVCLPKPSFWRWLSTKTEQKEVKTVTRLSRKSYLAAFFSADSMAFALCSVSAHSRSGSESMTMPAPDSI